MRGKVRPALYAPALSRQIETQLKQGEMPSCFTRRMRVLNLLSAVALRKLPEEIMAPFGTMDLHHILDRQISQDAIIDQMDNDALSVALSTGDLYPLWDTVEESSQLEHAFRTGWMSRFMEAPFDPICVMLAMRVRLVLDLIDELGHSVNLLRFFPEEIWDPIDPIPPEPDPIPPAPDPIPPGPEPIPPGPEPIPPGPVPVPPGPGPEPTPPWVDPTPTPPGPGPEPTPPWTDPTPDPDDGDRAGDETGGGDGQIISPGPDPGEDDLDPGDPGYDPGPGDPGYVAPPAPSPNIWGDLAAPLHLDFGPGSLWAAIRSEMHGPDCCADKNDPESSVGISYTTQQMSVGETQQISVYNFHPACNKYNYKWAIDSGGGTLTADIEDPSEAVYGPEEGEFELGATIYGINMLYHAPAANPECVMNAKIVLLCRDEVVASLTIAINEFGGVDIASWVFSGAYCSPTVDPDIWNCGITETSYDCQGVIVNGPTLRSTQAASCEACYATTIPTMHAQPIKTIAYAVAHPVVDVRTEYMIEHGCCPGELA